MIAARAGVVLPPKDKSALIKTCNISKADVNNAAKLAASAKKFEKALKAPKLKRPPSEHLKSGNVFFTAEVEERTLPYVLELLRPDVVLWASDFPHERERDQFGGDIPYLCAREDLSDEAKQHILFDNPARFYRLRADN